MPLPPHPTPPFAEAARQQAALEGAGAVFAELASGNPVAGDAAVAEAMREHAAVDAVSLSPHARAVRFWRSLLVSPGLRVGACPVLPAPLQGLSVLPPGLRVLVLLKALSGLGEVELAAVLERSPARCRQALTEAERMAGEHWQDWPSALAARVDAMPTARRVNIATRRSQPAPGPHWSMSDEGEAASGRVPRRTLAGVALATGLALAATWWPAGWRDDGEPHIRTRHLADAEARARFDAEAMLAAHPDRAVLEIPEADSPIARDTAFYAWYQAERLGTSSYEPPPPTFEAPENGASTADTGDAHGP